MFTITTKCWRYVNNTKEKIYNTSKGFNKESCIEISIFYIIKQDLDCKIMHEFNEHNSKRVLCT